MTIRTWRIVFCQGGSTSVNIFFQSFHSQVSIPVFQTSIWKIIGNHGGIYKFDKKILKKWGKESPKGSIKILEDLSLRLIMESSDP